MNLVETHLCIECGEPSFECYPDVHSPNGFAWLCSRHSGCVQTAPVTGIRTRPLDARGWPEGGLPPAYTYYELGRPPSLLERALGLLRRFVGR